MTPRDYVLPALRPIVRAIDRRQVQRRNHVLDEIHQIILRQPILPRARQRPVFTPTQIDQILAATAEPERSMFAVLAFTGISTTTLLPLTAEADRRLSVAEAAETRTYALLVN